MIELKNDALIFTFPEVHHSARLTVTFQRTLRIPDDGQEYPLPPGLGRFPMRHVDDFAANLPKTWIKHGGVLLPIHQAEALWINFASDWMEGHGVPYPFAVKVGCGKINAISGGRWSSLPHRRPMQDYLVVPNQPWLDGYCVGKGVIRQFVAMPLGEGFTAEEQATSRAEHGGLQIQVMPMRREAFDKRFPFRYPEAVEHLSAYEAAPEYGMGLAPGGKMRQVIAKDIYRLVEWDRSIRSRCFIHLAGSGDWRRITREKPPATPITAKAYTDVGLPWFSWYDEDATPVPGSETLARLKSVATLTRKKRRRPLPGNRSVKPRFVVPILPQRLPGQVREME